jgi:hypothetical protein
VALEAAFVAGAGLLAAAAWLVVPPAGLAVAGLFLVVVPVLYVRGRRAG